MSRLQPETPTTTVSAGLSPALAAMKAAFHGYPDQVGRVAILRLSLQERERERQLREQIERRRREEQAKKAAEEEAQKAAEEEAARKTTY